MRTPITGSLIFDSDRDGAGRGVRAGGGTDRSLAWQADHLGVELLIHRDGLEPELVQGQVIGTDHGRPVVGARVRFGEGPWSLTDEFGQFAMSSLAGSDRGVLEIQAPEGDVRCHLPGRD